jgi:CRP/FNR family transcriptional regulator, cyclic AMP receptor protein
MESQLLDAVDEGVRRDVLRQAQRRRFDRRQVLFHEGDPSGGMHLIQSGWVAVRLTTPLGDVATVAVIGPREPLGEQSLIEDDGRRSTSAVGLTAVETLYLSREIFDDLRRHHPSVDRFLASMFNDRLQRVSARLVEALYVPAPDRVLRRIAELAETFGPDSDIPLTQEDLASLAGTTRPTVNRVVRRAEKAGAVRASRGSLCVLDRELLPRLGH